MEEVTSSSRTQESSTENKANTSGSLNSTFSHQLVQNDSCEFSKERDSSSTNLAESTEKSSPPIYIETHSPESLQKLTDTDSLATSDLTSSTNLKENSSEELSEETNKQCVPSSSETWNKKSLHEIWTTDSEYGVSLRKFNEAFTCAVDTVVDLVKYRACYSCAAGSNAGDLLVDEMLSPFPPLVVPALKDAALLRAAQKGEWHALVHLLGIGARGDGTDCEKRNALHLACIGGWETCVYILLDLKAISGTKGRARASSWDPKTNFEAVDVFSKTPLDYAKEKSPNSSCACYIERAIELQYNKRVRKAKKKS